MGKKLKTLDSVVPCDVFDKVLLESHQAATVVLLLESPEDDVVVKACAAIYQFSEKCDENKLTLLNIDSIIERLLVLLLHDEHVIRRNACMAVASVSQHHDARKYLRKFKFAIPRIIKLIALEEDTVVHEFGTLCLTSLVGDFTGKAVFYQCGGLAPVVACLGSEDPDVVKNSIETLSLVLQDYEVKASFRDIPDAFSSVISLLKSEYPIIQYYALLTLTLAAEDGLNRAVLRELGIAQVIVDYLAQADTQDLHVFAVILLANCLDDYGIVKMFKDASGLQLLVGMVTEKQAAATDDEKNKEKDAKPKKDKASRASKNRDRDKGNAEEEMKARSKGIAEPIITVMPDVKEHVTRAIARAARYTICQKVFHEGEIEKKLLALLSQEKTPAIQVSIVLALGVMADLDLSREVMNKLEGVEPLVKSVAKKDNPDMLEVVSLALANLTVHHPGNCQQLLKCGAVPLLISLLSDPRELTASHAATALSNMAPHGELCMEIINLKAVPALIAALANTESFLVQSRVLWTLGALVINAGAQNQFVELGGLEPLIRLLHSGDMTVLRNASWVLSLIANDELLAVEICKMECLEILRQIQLSMSKQNRFADMALARLYNSQLIAKYAYTGYLGPENLIPDGFYDVGQLKSSDQLRVIEEYGKEEITDQRPILFINPKPEILTIAAPASEADSTEKTNRSTVQGTGRTSRTSGRDAKSKRGAKDKDDKHAEKVQQKDEDAAQAALQKEAAEKLAQEAAAKEPQVFVPPPDPTLMCYIEQVIERIQPLMTAEEQASALAKFVSEKTGGPVAADQLANYDWETHISQLKHNVGSNVLSIGLIRTGFFCHRALLFKVLADRVGLQSALVRGEYNRAWNEIILPSVDVTVEVTKPIEPKAFIVDIMFEPGRLINACSCEALAYMTAYSWTGKC